MKIYHIPSFTLAAFVSLYSTTLHATVYEIFAESVNDGGSPSWGAINQAVGNPGCDGPCQCDENNEQYAWNGSASTGGGDFACLDPFPATGHIGYDNELLVATFGGFSLPPNEHIKNVVANALCRYNYNEPGGTGGKIRIRAELDSGEFILRDSNEFANTDPPNENPDDNCRYRMGANGDITALASNWTASLINNNLTVGVRRFDDGTCHSRLRVKAIRLTIETTVCGDGIVEAPEQCDGGPCCDTNCQYRPVNYVCGPSAGICDPAEFCSGDSSQCPINSFYPPTYVCREDAGDCDVPEYCPGNSAICPGNSYAPAEALCHADIAPGGGPNLCTIDECDGEGNCLFAAVVDCFDGDDCTTDECVPETAECRWTPTQPPPAECPAVSEWGLAILTLTGLIVGTIMFTQKKSTALS